MGAVDEFKRRLEREWLVPFCNKRGYSHEGFDGKAIGNLRSADASDFMLAIDSGLVTHDGGVFRAARSEADEQIFSQGAKDSVPRKVTLWLEPIITMAGLLRLQRDFLWPASQLGLQSRTWAFDLVAYDADLSTERLVCEVKKTEQEVDTLLRLMERHLDTPASAISEFKSTERNAFKKVLALRESASSVFWALGPGGYGHVFKVIRDRGRLLGLERAAESLLKAPSFAGFLEK